MTKKATNRIKAILAEKNKSSKWLAEKLEMNPSTISRWCTNNMQPPIDKLSEVANILNVDIRAYFHLLKRTK